MLHGREDFSSASHGVRHLQGTYVNIDDFACRLHALSHQLGQKDSSCVRVANSSF